MANAAATLRAMALGGIIFITAGMAGGAVRLPIKKRSGRSRNVHNQHVKRHDYRVRRQESMRMKDRAEGLFTNAVEEVCLEVSF